MPNYPKPTAKKKLEGTHRKDRGVKNEMQVSKVAGIPDPPKTLDKVGSNAWMVLCSELNANGLLCSTDIALVHDYCYYEQVKKKSQEAVKKCGAIDQMTNKGGHTNSIVSAHFKVIKECTEMQLKIAIQFGFTPSARTRISSPKKQDEGDPLEKLLNQ